jgi:UDP-N-acetylglucosamine--N-acetylmuramyl-(pentapeptide) pyrophosphoryl-undecaprenol N-acetylglucosamine transferase
MIGEAKSLQTTYIIAGGGTGGHIYPGVAVARSLKKLDPSCQIVFVGTASGLESKIVPREGFTLELIQVGKLNHGGGLLGKLKTLLQLPLAFVQSFRILKRLEPAAVLGVGGYASGPLVLMASFMGFPTAIWEANAHPGMTNRWLSNFVRKSYLVFKEAQPLLHSRKSQVMGLPVRDEIESPMKSTVSSTFRILIVGGSQGSRAINNGVAAAIQKGGDWLQGLKIVHQCGVHDYQDLKQRYQGHESVVEVHEFLYDMNVQYANCDLVICRGGASTVAELSASGKVALVIPLPTAADNHQQKNAETLVKSQAGVLLLQKDLNPENLIHEIQKLRNDPELRMRMSENIRKLFIPHAAQNMARDLMEGLGK